MATFILLGSVYYSTIIIHACLFCVGRNRQRIKLQKVYGLAQVLSKSTNSSQAIQNGISSGVHADVIQASMEATEIKKAPSDSSGESKNGSTQQRQEPKSLVSGSKRRMNLHISRKKFEDM
jgi:hypothetical protein